VFIDRSSDRPSTDGRIRRLSALAALAPPLLAFNLKQFMRGECEKPLLPGERKRRHDDGHRDKEGGHDDGGRPSQGGGVAGDHPAHLRFTGTSFGSDAVIEGKPRSPASGQAGVGESTGNAAAAAFDDLAYDAIPAHEALRRRANVDPTEWG
jgi:hypothetical protein